MPMILGAEWPAQCSGQQTGLYFDGGVVGTSIHMKPPDGNKTSSCCEHCCWKSFSADVWSLAPNGNCTCHILHNIDGQNPAPTAREGWCTSPNPHPDLLQRVPKDFDDSKWVTTGDSRAVVSKTSEINYQCSYPNDPTTRDKIEKAVREQASNDSYTALYCDKCLTYTAPSDGPAAYFCQEAEFKGTGIFNFTKIYYNTSVKNARNPCTIPEKYTPRVEQMVLGKKNGIYQNFGPEKCSPTQPDPVCVPINPRFPPCHPLHPPKNGSCGFNCKLDTRIEYIDVRFQWYQLTTMPMDLLHID